ncbi:MAG: hypothetical protein U0271_46335 [Polyangiaceae bacterium]
MTTWAEEITDRLRAFCDDVDPIPRLELVAFSMNTARAELDLELWTDFGEPTTRYRVTVLDPIDHALRLGKLEPPKLETTGRVLEPYLEPILAVSITRAPTDPAACLEALESAYQRWRVFDWSIPAFPGFHLPPLATLSRGRGTLADCPTKLADAYVSVLEAFDAGPSTSPTKPRSHAFEAVTFGRAFVIGSRIEGERTPKLTIA